MSERTLNDIMNQRKAKVNDFREQGIEPYPHGYQRSHMITEALGVYDQLAGQSNTTLAGRLMSRRIMGKASFAHIMDGSGRIQLYLSKQDIGETSYAHFKKMDIGDFVGVRGEMMTTRTGGSDGGGSDASVGTTGPSMTTGSAGSSPPSPGEPRGSSRRTRSVQSTAYREGRRRGRNPTKSWRGRYSSPENR